MPCGVTDIVDIVGADALLGIGDPSVLRGEGAVKVFLQGCDTGVDPKQSGIVVGN